MIIIIIIYISDNKDIINEDLGLLTKVQKQIILEKLGAMKKVRKLVIKFI